LIHLPRREKTPITDAERAYFRRWIDSRHHIEDVLEQEVAPDMDFTFTYHTQLEYLPGEAADTEYFRFMEGNNKLSFFGPEARLTPTTDMKPYISDVLSDRKEVISENAARRKWRPGPSPESWFFPPTTSS